MLNHKKMLPYDEYVESTALWKWLAETGGHKDKYPGWADELGISDSTCNYCISQTCNTCDLNKIIKISYPQYLIKGCQGLFSKWHRLKTYSEKRKYYARKIYNAHLLLEPFYRSAKWVKPKQLPYSDYIKSTALWFYLAKTGKIDKGLIKTLETEKSLLNLCFYCEFVKQKKAPDSPQCEKCALNEIGIQLNYLKPDRKRWHNRDIMCGPQGLYWRWELADNKIKKKFFARKIYNAHLLLTKSYDTTANMVEFEVRDLLESLKIKIQEQRA